MAAALTRSRGFSLLELTVAIVIVAILISAALPMYQQHSSKVHRLDGQNKLIEVMRQQQSFFARHLRYSDQLEDELNIGADNGVVSSDRKFYTITAEACEDNLKVCVRLVAAPVETAQQTLTLDSLGRRTPDSAW